MPIYALKRARSGSDLPTVSTSPLPIRPRRYHRSVVCRTRFHEIARAAGAKKTYRRSALISSPHRPERTLKRQESATFDSSIPFVEC
jgi:hypothetical protein